MQQIRATKQQNLLKNLFAKRFHGLFIVCVIVEFSQDKERIDMVVSLPSAFECDPLICFSDGTRFQL